MRILIYNGDFHFPVFVRKLGEYLVKEGHSVIFMGHGNQRWPFQSGGIRYYPLPWFHQWIRLCFRLLVVYSSLLIHNPRVLGRIKQTLQQDHKRLKGQKGKLNRLMDALRLGVCENLKPDVIHNQWSPSLAALGPLFRHFPIVQSLHGRLEDVTPFHNATIANIYSHYFPLLAGIHADSHLLVKNARSFGAKTPNAYVSHALVSADWLSKTPTGNHKHNELRILSIGKFTYQKGYLYALEAMKFLKEKVLPFHYEIIGWGDEEALRFHLDDLKLKGAVTIYQHLDHSSVYNKLKSADLLLLPSVEEGFATVATEAMALRVPLITTNCGGMAELIVHKSNGWLVPTHDAKAIAGAILDFNSTSTEEVAQITNNAQNLVMQQLTWEDQIKNYVELYQSALS